MSVPYNKKFCDKHCPYIRELNGKYNFECVGHLILCADGIIKEYQAFYVNGRGTNYSACIEMYGSNILPLYDKDTSAFKYLKEHADMETMAKRCPIYDMMMMENYSK